MIKKTSSTRPGGEFNQANLGGFVERQKNVLPNFHTDIETKEKQVETAKHLSLDAKNILLVL